MPIVSDLTVFDRSHQLAVAVYQATQSFPIVEKFGLMSQMRRAAISIGANLAEGGGRGSDREFARFVAIAQGSVGELAYQLLVSSDLGYMDEQISAKLQSECSEIGKMLHGLRRTLLSSASRN